MKASSANPRTDEVGATILSSDHLDPIPDEGKWCRPED